MVKKIVFVRLLRKKMCAFDRPEENLSWESIYVFNINFFTHYWTNYHFIVNY